MARSNEASSFQEVGPVREGNKVAHEMLEAAKLLQNIRPSRYLRNVRRAPLVVRLRSRCGYRSRAALPVARDAASSDCAAFRDGRPAHSRILQSLRDHAGRVTAARYSPRRVRENPERRSQCGDGALESGHWRGAVEALAKAPQTAGSSAGAPRRWHPHQNRDGNGGGKPDYCGFLASWVGRRWLDDRR